MSHSEATSSTLPSSTNPTPETEDLKENVIIHSNEYWDWHYRQQDQLKFQERQHRNRDPELRAAKQAMLRATLKALNESTRR